MVLLKGHIDIRKSKLTNREADERGTADLLCPVHFSIFLDEGGKHPRESTQSARSQEAG